MESWSGTQSDQTSHELEEVLVDLCVLISVKEKRRGRNGKKFQLVRRYLDHVFMLMDET